MINIAVCDDEKVFRDEIADMLKCINHDYFLKEFSSGTELLESDFQFDILFLDINMTGKNGMETAAELRGKNIWSRIIFLTSHDEYMPDAFKVKAYRFLTKPIKLELLKEAVKSAEKEILNFEKITLTKKGVTTYIDLKKILYFEAFGDGTYAHSVSETFESPKQLKYWIEKLGTENFFQTHKSYYISLRHVKKFSGTEVELSGVRDPIPLSRRKAAKFKEAFFNYVKSNACII